MQGLKSGRGAALAMLLALAATVAVGATPEKRGQKETSKTLPRDASKDSAAAVLATFDADLIRNIVRWREGTLSVSDAVALDPDLRASAAALTAEHLKRLRALIPTWIAEERAAAKNPTLSSAALAAPLFARLINEMAFDAIDSAGPEHDRLLRQAVLSPEACRYWVGTAFARRLSMIQAAPAEIRPALLSAEATLLSRWGRPRPDLPPRPAKAQLDAAEHAVTLLRQGLPTSALPMTPFLAGRAFHPDRKPDTPDYWQKCARNQWWLRSQLADGKTDPVQALTLFRYAMLAPADEFVPKDYRSGPPPTGELAMKQYPRAAEYFNVQGTTTVRVALDGKGTLLSATVIDRKIRVAGVRNARPLAFETVFDQASLDSSKERTYPTGPAAAQFETVWNLLEEADDEK